MDAYCEVADYIGHNEPTYVVYFPHPDEVYWVGLPMDNYEGEPRKDRLHVDAGEGC